MKNIILLNGEHTLVDDEDFEYLNQFKWYLSINGYVVARKGQKRKTILMHRLINKTPEGFQTDHINRNKLDNRKKNLRTASFSQNAMNTGLFRHNTSGYKGVSWEKKRSKWYAQIMVARKCKFLGYFNNIQDAILARKEAERKYAI